MRINGNVDHIRTEKLLKDIFSELDHVTLSEVKYCISVVVVFPVSEAIVESWGSVIENVLSINIAFTEANLPDITEIIYQISGPIANRKLFKSALILMYGGVDFATHFTVNSRKGFTSKGMRILYI